MMSDLENWQKENDRYLSAALNWLRLLLELSASRQQQPFAETIAQAGADVATARRSRFKWGSQTPAGSAPVRLLPPAKISAEQVAEAASEMRAVAKEMNPPPALLLLARRFNLSRFERQVLLLCAALEMDTRLPALCARAQGEASLAYPTFALAMAVFDEPVWDARSPRQPLRHWQLIEINQPGAKSLTTSALRADERIVNYIKGLNYLDDRLMSLVIPLDSGDEEPELPPSQRAVADLIIRELSQESRPNAALVMQLVGADSVSKKMIVANVARSLGLIVYAMPVDALPTGNAEIETLARLWQRESMLLPLALYIEAGKQPASETGGKRQQLEQLLARSGGLFFIDTRDVIAGASIRFTTLDVAKPTPGEQQAQWTAALNDKDGESAALLSEQFNLNAATINRIARASLDNITNDPRTLEERLWEGCLISTRPQLDTLAQRLDPKARWEDIVLPETEKKLLEQISHQVSRRGTVYEEWGFRNRMNRGLGISALFAGESGTGKTMAAEVIANDLRLNLYRIDLSAVVSKFVGETEKNLRRLFDAAEDGGAILFFDEADAIFGKRSEVKDAHDRYANIEINYLLQRMEAYRGLAILATNMKSALDPAFMRRIRFVVNFAFPAADERKEIWQKVFPQETPVERLDYDRLKLLDLTGGSIHNIALNAAFMAAHVGSPVTMPLIFEAARVELRKLGRPVNEADFRWNEPEKRLNGSPPAS